MEFKKVYIVMTHLSAPNKYARSTEDAWVVTENCEFVTSLKNRHLTQATIILDYTNKVLYKSRLHDITFDTYIEYLDREYKEKMERLRQLVDGVESSNLTDTSEIEENV